MTGYVATRWYRAPEIMLNWMHYNQTGDVSPCGAAVLWGWGGQAELIPGPGVGGAKPRMWGSNLVGPKA